MGQQKPCGEYTMKAKTCEAGDQFGDFFNIIGKKLCGLNQGVQNNELKNILLLDG